MDDLISVEWGAPKTASAGQQYPQPPGNYYPALRPTPPSSGISTPLSVQHNHQVVANIPARSNSSTPANDSFANLVSFNASQSNKGLSLQEKQRKLLEDRRQEEEDKGKAFDAQFGSEQGGSAIRGKSRTVSPPIYDPGNGLEGPKIPRLINDSFANTLNTTSSTSIPTSVQNENDLLAAFDASAPVDRSSHMPDIPRSLDDEKLKQVNGLPLRSQVSSLQVINGMNGDYTEGLDDDPFGLRTSLNKTSAMEESASNKAIGDDDDDDVLGLLSRPVSDFAQRREAEPRALEAAKEVGSHPQERAVAELIEMGFARDKSQSALETTDTGIDVQAAVGWLLNQAHEESRVSSRPQGQEKKRAGLSIVSESVKAPTRRKSSSSGSVKPAWMGEQGRPQASQRRTDNISPVNGDKDPTQYASELGNKMFKTAGSLWKSGTKKLNQAVQDLNSDSDSNQPKWMRETQVESGSRKPRTKHRESDIQNHDRMERPKKLPAAQTPNASVTDEALMLEADFRPPPRKTLKKPSIISDGTDSQKDQLPVASRPREQVLPQPKYVQQVLPRDAKARLSRQAVEEETSQAYISPARRKRPTPKPAAVELQSDLLFESSKTSSQPGSSRPTPSPRPQTTASTSLPIRPAPSERDIPPLSSFALQTSTKGRQEGNAAFKRGDYAQATTHYSSSLSVIPLGHPLTVVLLTNRALSHSKTGDSKASLADAKSTLDLIGSSRGVGERIDLGGDETSKQMSTYWEKAMIRQAEALEHLERWSDAAAVWRSCVEAGIGGATSSAGKNRCEKAAAPPTPREASSAPKKVTIKPRPKPTALSDFPPDSESVTRLRAANAAADRLDDEKFALADVVDQRISRWRTGKEGNLRALLSTLENVLWEESGWKKVGMGDVLLPGKVKLVYMKGIAKVHPDKVILKSIYSPLCLLLSADDSFLRLPLRSRR